VTSASFFFVFRLIDVTLIFLRWSLALARVHLLQRPVEQLTDSEGSRRTNYLYSYQCSAPIDEEEEGNRETVNLLAVLHCRQMSSFQLDKSSIPLIAGFSGGVVSTTLLLPLDVVKTRLQVTEGKSQKHFQSFRIIGGIIKYEGVAGLYQGWTPAVLGSAISWGGYFYFYEGFKQRLVDYKLGQTEQGRRLSRNSTSAQLNSVENFVLACAAGSVMVAITNPVWLVKTRMQLQMKRASEKVHIRPYRSMIDAFRTIVREEGWLALYKGSGPALLLTSHGGVQFVVYECLRKYFQYARVKRGENGNDLSVWKRLELSAGYLTMGAISKLYV
jgi:solute carrier family 25 folate transporter 32